jgi:hypothetical protein
MARAGARETIVVRTSTRKDRNMLEWKPRLIALIFVVVLVGLLAGFAESTEFVGPMNWEW